MKTYKQKYDETKSWFKKAMIIHLYRNVLLVRKKPSSVRVLAAYFGTSVGNVSESILIGNNHKIVSRCKTRKIALELIKQNNHFES